MGLSNGELARRFAAGDRKGKGSHLFIEGDTIYSYGFHFPIARRDRVYTYVVNTNGYSSTTARHKSLVLGAIGDKFLLLPECDLTRIEETYWANSQNIELLQGQEQRARTTRSRERIQDHIKFLESQNQIMSREVIITRLEEAQ